MSSAAQTGKPNWTFGTGATTREKCLAYSAAVLGCAAFALNGHDKGWAWWQWLIGLLMVWDLAGGVVANGLDAAKRFYHSPLAFHAGAVPRFLHHPVGFTAVHLQPVIACLVLGGTRWWWWGALWYLWALAGAVAVELARARYQRPLALGIVGIGAMVAPLVEAPPGLAWLPVVLLLKLVVAHAVPEGVGSSSREGR
ncbi:hypothetical protein ACH4LN_12340 [Streptomyces albus]|uniref:Uncharacterized protein n=1 Tax=Streptomyces albus TaxID=1888 RepID=A0A6C1BXC9_9ACTN|nr:MULTISPECIES: hypothetical protein [Streptomyces]EPD96563.1 hypothetical protein HMPREF1486_00738 [Streptomyces sp. HPH0547]MDI6411231.1 hypothetical protein [Streptomyces albus]QID35223.1 hypothetical protein G3260_001152 [Streptomyces albus]TGG88528.1 hypothetical protein D8771_03390 [Streptomyces albus]UVN57996.1 hypothetical protein NR995_28345 [Streptomyces albus]